VHGTQDQSSSYQQWSICNIQSNKPPLDQNAAILDLHGVLTQGVSSCRYLQNEGNLDLHDVLSQQCLLQGISKNLVEKAFPVAERPDYLTGADFYKFTPAEEFMSLPGDIARTEFRLVVTHEGWEYCILERDLGAHLDSQRNMLVTVRITANNACLSKNVF